MLILLLDLYAVSMWAVFPTFRTHVLDPSFGPRRVGRVSGRVWIVLAPTGPTTQSRVRRQKNVVMSPARLRTKIDCAGEDQQQFMRDQNWSAGGRGGADARPRANEESVQGKVIKRSTILTSTFTMERAGTSETSAILSTVQRPKNRICDNKSPRKAKISNHVCCRYKSKTFVPECWFVDTRVLSLLLISVAFALVSDWQ
jgi:hypothetical protein